MALRWETKLNAKQAHVAHKLIVDGSTVKDTAALFGISGKAMLTSIRRYVDKNFIVPKHRKLSRTLTREQYDYCMKFLASGAFARAASIRILAKKFGWSFQTMLATFAHSDSYESAMEYADKFVFNVPITKGKHQ